MPVSVEQQLENDRRSILGETQPTQSIVPPAANPSQKTEVSKGGDQFTENMSAILRGVAATAAGVVGAEDTAREQAEAAARKFQVGSEVGPRIQSLSQAKTAKDAYDFIQGSIGSQGPQFAVTLGAAGVGGLLAGPPGAVALGGATAAAMEAGADAPEILLDPEAKGTIQDRAMVNAASGIIRGSLEALPALRVLKGVKALKGVNIEQEVIKRLPRRLIERFLQQGALESGTEVVQQAISIATHKFVNDNIDVLSDENLWSLADAAVAGFFVGGGAGTLMGGKSAPKGLKKEKDRLQDRLDAHLSGEKSLETQIEEEAAGKDSMADITARERDVSNLKDAVEENIPGERKTSTSERVTAGRDALLRAARAKGIKVDELSDTAKKFADNASKFKYKVKTLSDAQLENLRNADPNSVKGRAFNATEAGVEKWYQFSESYPNAVRTARIVNPTTGALPGFFADAPTTDPKSPRSQLDGMMAEIQALGLRKQEKGLTDREKEIIDRRAKKIITKIMEDQEMVDEVGQAALALEGGVVELSEEMRGYVQRKASMGIPVEIIAEKLNVPVDSIAAAIDPDEKFLMNSRQGYSRAQIKEFEQVLDDDIQDVGGDEIKVGAMQNAFERLTSEQMAEVMGATKPFAEQMEAQLMEEAAGFYGFSIDEAQTQPQPVTRGDGLPKVTKHRLATGAKDKKTSAEKSVEEFNAVDGPKSNRKRTLENFAEYLAIILNKPPKDRNEVELALIADAKTLDDEVTYDVFKGDEFVGARKTTVGSQIRFRLNLAGNVPFSGFQITMEEVLNPEIISGVPYLLDQKQTEESLGQFSDTTKLPADPHSTVTGTRTIVKNGVVTIQEREINIPRLVARARSSLLNRSPAFFKDVLQDAEGNPSVDKFDQILLSLHHGIADLITRGVIDAWPRLQNHTVVDWIRGKDSQTPVLWRTLKESGKNVRIAAMMKDAELYLFKRAEAQIIKNVNIARNKGPVKFKGPAVLAAGKWLARYGIKMGDVKISENNETIENIDDFMGVIQKIASFGMREEFMAVTDTSEMTAEQIEAGALAYYIEAAENKAEIAKKNLEGIREEFNKDLVKDQAKRVVRTASRTHTQRVDDFLRLADTLIAIEGLEKNAKGFAKDKGAFESLIEELRDITGERSEGLSDLFTAARAQQNEYYFNYLSETDRTLLEEVIGQLDIPASNRDQGEDIKDKDAPLHGAHIDVQNNLDAGFFDDAPNDTIHNTYHGVPTLHTPYDFFVAQAHNVDSMIEAMRKSGKVPEDRAQPLGAWVKDLWRKHMQAFKVDEAAIKERFDRDFSKAQEVMEKVHAGLAESALRELIQKRVGRNVFPAFTLDSWDDMKAAAPRTPKARKLIKEREVITRSQAFHTATDAEVLQIHPVFLQLNTDATVQQRRAAVRLLGAPHQNDFANYRDYIVAELRRIVPSLQYPKGRTYRDVFMPVEGVNVMEVYERLSKRISESQADVKADGVLSDFIRPVDMKIVSYLDLSNYLLSMKLKATLQGQQVLEAFADNYRGANARIGEYPLDPADSEIVTGVTMTAAQSNKGSKKVAKDYGKTDSETWQEFQERSRAGWQERVARVREKSKKKPPEQKELWGDAPFSTHVNVGEVYAGVRQMIDNMSTATFQTARVGQIGGHAGHYDPIRNVIRIANNLQQDWIMGIGAHEALHSVFQQLLKPNALRALSRAMRHPIVSQKILRFYKQYGTDDATMRKIQNAIDPVLNPNTYIEERAAYAFQAFVMSRRGFKLAPAPTTIFQKVVLKLKHILRYLTEYEQADQLFEHIYSGEVKRAADRGESVSLRKEGQWMLPEAIVDFAHNAYMSMGHWNRAFLTPMDIAMRRTKIPALIKLADLIYRSPAYTDSRNNEPTFIKEYQRQRIKWTDHFQKKWDTMSPQRQKAIHKNLYSRVDPDTLSGMERADVMWFRTFFDGMRGYAIALKADLGDIDQYVPIVWSPEQVAAHEGELRAILAGKDPALVERFGGPDQIIENLKTAGDVWDDMQQIGLDHRESSAKPRKYGALFNDQDLGMFMQQDFEMTMQSYVKQMTRHAEYQRFLGKDGSKAQKLVKLAEQQGASPQEIQDAVKYVLAARGVLGSNMSERASKWTSWLVTYQHIRVLPFATFSSFVEAQGIAVRSQSIEATWAAYKVAFKQVQALYVNTPRMREIKKRIKELKAKPSLRPEEDVEFERLVKERHEMRTANVRFAEDMSTLDAAIMYDELLSSNGALGMTTTTTKINKHFFKWIGLEAWTNLTRTMASRAAYVFIKENIRHPRKHSARFLRELNLQPSDVMFDADGEIIYTVEGMMAQDPNLSRADAHVKAEKFRAAVWQFVDESVMRPNAAQRPLNASDPHWVMLFHLKQYIFSVQTQIINRAVKEAAVHKNGLPLANLMSFVPVMMAADYMRSSIQYAFNDEEESPFERYSFEQLVARSARRSGILGVVEPFTGFGENINRFGGTGFEVLIGPAPQQALELSRTLLSGSPTAWTAMKNALPANNVYRHWGVPIY